MSPFHKHTTNFFAEPADARRFSPAVKIEYLADRPEHVPTLAAWHRREWGHLRPEESLETRAAKLQAWNGRHQIPTVFIASVEETLLGAAMLVKHDMDSRPQWSPWLAGVIVAPAHRGHGIGTALTKHAVTEAKSLGLPKLYLYTFSTELYYARLGWQLIERDRYLGAAVAIMSFDLK